MNSIKMSVEIDGNSLIFECPHCKHYIIVHKQEINCTIFRHGVMKSNFIQISPHLPKTECDRLFSENIIFGCGKPFRILTNDNTFLVIECGYI